VVVGRGGSLTHPLTGYKIVYNSVLKEPGHPEGSAEALKHKAVTKNTVYDP